MTTGGNLNVDLTVANVTNLGGYDVFIQFNPSVVHMTSLTDAGFVTNNPDPNNLVICNTATINNTNGTASDSCATVAIFGSPGPGVASTPPVALMHASFTAVGLGTSALTLTGSTLQDPVGNVIAASLGSATINVTQPTVLGGVDANAGTAPIASASSHAAADHGANSGEATAIALTILLIAAWRALHHRKRRM